MHVTVIANPQIDSLLTPTDNAIQLTLQLKDQPIDKLQIVARQGCFLDLQQMGLQFIARGFQGVLQLAQCTGGF